VFQQGRISIFKGRQATFIRDRLLITISTIICKVGYEELNMNNLKHYAFAAIAALTVSVAPGLAGTLYEAPDTPAGGFCPTCAGTSTTMGDDISLSSGPATLQGLIWDTSNYGADYDADIQVNLYNVDLSGSNAALGTLFHSQTTTHFLAGGSGSPARTFVDISLPDVMAPERFIYTISVLNNNGGTNWNMVGSFAGTPGDANPNAAQAVIGTNSVLDTIWGDWTLTPGADPNTLALQELTMASYQFGLPGNEAWGANSHLTLNVDFYGEVPAVPLPATLPMLAGAFGIAGALRARRKRG
jgi:hypothetical protein